MHLAVDGDVVICIGTMSGTHEGELLGVPASGRRVEWRMCHLTTFDAGGRAIEHSAIRDDLGLMRQMGAAVAFQAGSMFWLRWNTLPGS